MIIILSPTVYASEFNMNNYTSASLNGTKNRYRATEIYNSGISSTYTFGTRYSGQISDIETYFDYPFEANTTYRLTYNMSTEDFRNKFGSSYWWDCDDDMTSNNAHVFTPTYISYKKVQFSFKPSSNTTCIRAWLRSSNISSVAITGVSNWNLSSITIYDPAWQSGSGSGQGTITPTPTPTSDYSSIINNQNNNTQDIINNNNQNTSDIINNNNQNTQDIINNQNELLGNKCSNLWNSTLQVGPFAYSDGLHYNFNTFYSNSSSIDVQPGDYYISYETQADRGDNGALFYNNGQYISYQMLNSNGVIHVPNGANQLNFNFISNNGQYKPTNIMLTRGTSSKSYCEYGSYSSKLDDTTNAINDVNNSINNSNVENSVGIGFFNDFTSQDFGLSQIITIPLNTIQGLTSKTCVPLQVPIPFTNSNINLPCMTEIYETKFSSIYNLWKIVSFGIVAYLICIDIFHIVKGFKDPESDKVEVLDL